MDWSYELDKNNLHEFCICYGPQDIYWSYRIVSRIKKYIYDIFN